MNLDDFRNLDTEDPGSWPPVVKAVALLLVVGLIVAGGWYFFWQDQMRELERVTGRERELRETFEIRQRRAANLEAYEAQLEEMRKTFGDMLRQLPSRAEVSKLLVDISQTGLSSGLAFDLFKPQDPITREFYAELPVEVQVKGGYHEFARFVSGVANLPRIVTLDDIEITLQQDGGNSGQDLTMTLTARTYWYLDGDEEGEG